jgi:pectin methylesterase-like acyl-CoA thioesterase
MSSFRAAESEHSDAEPQLEAHNGLSRRAFAVAALATSAIPLAVAVAGPAAAAGTSAGSAGTRAGAAKPAKVPPTPDFGPNVQIFDPTTPAATIQAAVDAAAAQQVPAEFGTGRFAFFFKPGTYNADIQLGYYTSVAGLGLSPDDVTINGEIRVEGQLQSDGTVNGLTNFWRSMENLSIVPTDGINWFAVSQAAPIRRVHVKGSLFLFPRQGGY